MLEPKPAVVTSSSLIGRDAELAYLDAVALRARAGSFELAVVSGEAGIGKTALLRAWASRRVAAGETALFAACGALDRALPLDALLSALGQFLRRLGPEASADLLDADAHAGLLGERVCVASVPWCGCSQLAVPSGA